MTRERLAAAKKLRLILVAGVGCAPTLQPSKHGLVGQCLQRRQDGSHPCMEQRISIRL